MTPSVHTGTPRHPLRWLGALALVAITTAGLTTTASAQSQEEARAIFLYNFAKFVEWPAETFANNATPVTIAVVGDATVAKALERYVKGKNANGRDIAVRTLDAADGCADSQIVFVGDQKFCADVMTRIAGRPVLSVGNDEAFIKAGGVIRLFAQDNKIMCAINLKAAAAAGLKLGERLLKASS